VITGVKEYVIEPGDSIWVLALREYSVPMWLFRQYNPDVDPETVRPGRKVRFPLLAPVEQG
jgi:LysM repeat protein